MDDFGTVMPNSCCSFTLQLYTAVLYLTLTLKCLASIVILVYALFYSILF